MRHLSILSTVIAALALAALAPREARAQQKGKIYVSDVEYGTPGSEKELAGALKRQSKTVIKGEEGTWQLNLMVFLNAAPGANAINIVYYDLSKKNEQVDFAEVGGQAGPEDHPAQRADGVEGEGLRQRPQVRHPRHARHRRQREGLRESDDHVEVRLRGAVVCALVAVVVADPACSRAPRKPPAPGELPVYRDPDRAPADRAADLVGRMTVSEKIAQTMTAAPAIPRLGVPAYEWWSEALHGVARAGRATVFPQAIALAATFDETLMRQVATVMSDEGRAKFNLAQARGDPQPATTG